jgi:putative nucleotidyltransferase with HDIG domain
MEKIADFMNDCERCFDASLPVTEAIAFMRAKNRGAVLVTRGGQPRGIFTERDVLLKLDFSRPDSIASLSLGEVMSERLVTAGPGISCGEALALMRSHGIRNLPIVEGGAVLGMVSLRSLLGHYSSHLERLLGESIDALTAAIGQRDPYTADHQRRVSAISTAVGRALGMEPEREESLRMAALAHDVGKIDVPIELLSKPGRLSRPEFELIKQHPVAGAAILASVDFERPVDEYVLQHHERMDGSGYPGGLKGEAIHLEARIIAVADVFEAIMSFRPYRPALGVDTARSEIETGRGKAFDAEVVNAFLGLLDDPDSAVLASFGA